MKLTFRSFGKQQFVFQQTGGDLSDMGHMFVDGAGENQDVVQVHKNKSIEEVPQDVINHTLKDCRGIGEPESHYQILEVT